MQAIRYLIAQIVGGIFGIIICHLMFFDSIKTIAVLSEINRSGGPYLAEILGTFILVLCIISLVH